MRHHGRRGVALAALALLVAVLITLPAEHILHEPGLFMSMLLVVGLIVLGTLGDLLAVAAVAAAAPALHSMAARRRRGASPALWLKQHADRVASISGDIVGDVAGTVSGAAAGAWAVTAAARHGWPTSVAAGLAVAVVAALTVGAKGTMKGVAMEHANTILYAAGVVAHGLGLGRDGGRGRARRRPAPRRGGAGR